jgi:Arc/MetJ-type ribon-helix-helix transcriptional regulator
MTIGVTLGSMPRSITFRAGADAERALAALTSDGTSVSDAVRAALVDAAQRRIEVELRAEAARLVADEGDRAEAAQILRDLESLRAW